MYNILNNESNFIALFLIILLATLVISYVLIAYPLYKMYKSAGLKNPKFALIPIIGGLKIYNLANLTMWVALILMVVAFIPFIGTLIVSITGMYVTFKTCENFGCSTFVCILSMFFGVFVYWYIVLTNKPFIGQINDKYKEETQYSM